MVVEQARRNDNEDLLGNVFVASADNRAGDMLHRYFMGSENWHMFAATDVMGEDVLLSCGWN